MGSLVSPKRLRQILRMERLARGKKAAAKDGVPPPSRQPVFEESSPLELLRTVDLPQPPDSSGGKQTSFRMLAAVVSVALLFITIMGLTFFLHLREDDEDNGVTAQESRPMHLAPIGSPTNDSTLQKSTGIPFRTVPSRMSRASPTPSKRPSTSLTIPTPTVSLPVVISNDTSTLVGHNLTSVSSSTVHEMGSTDRATRNPTDNH